jgi:hypothetical protein
MSFKPFKSPLLVNPGVRSGSQSAEPPLKRRKVSTEGERAPLAVLNNSSTPEAPTHVNASNGGTMYYLVLW